MKPPPTNLVLHTLLPPIKAPCTHYCCQPPRLLAAHTRRRLSLSADDKAEQHVVPCSMAIADLSHAIMTAIASMTITVVYLNCNLI
jgi:hypothetical protein